MVNAKLKRYATKPERRLDVSGLRIIETISDRFAAAVGYRNYRVFKKLSRYEDNIAHELQKMEKKLAVQMKGSPFLGKAGCR